MSWGLGDNCTSSPGGILAARSEPSPAVHVSCLFLGTLIPTLIQPPGWDLWEGKAGAIWPRSSPHCTLAAPSQPTALPHITAFVSLGPKPSGSSNDFYVFKIWMFCQAVTDASHSRHMETHDPDSFSISGQVKVPLLCLKHLNFISAAIYLVWYLYYYCFSLIWDFLTLWIKAAEQQSHSVMRSLRLLQIRII